MSKVNGKCRTRVNLGERPADVPTGWVVYNAPRPIYGQMEWSGPCFSGVFYTAICPQGALFEQYDTKNSSLDAVVLCYMSEAEAINLTRERLVARDPGKAEAIKVMPPAVLMQSFWHLLDTGEIQADGYNV